MSFSHKEKMTKGEKVSEELKASSISDGSAFWAPQVHSSESISKHFSAREGAITSFVQDGEVDPVCTADFVLHAYETDKWLRGKPTD